MASLLDGKPERGWEYGSMSSLTPQALLQRLPHLVREDYAVGDDAARASATRDLWSVVNGLPIDATLAASFDRLALGWHDGGRAAIADLLSAGDRLQVFSPSLSRLLRTTLLGVEGVSGGPMRQSEKDLEAAVDQVAGDYSRGLPGLWEELSRLSADWPLSSARVGELVATRYGPIAIALRVGSDRSPHVDPEDLLWISALAAWRVERRCCVVAGDAIRRWIAADPGLTIDHDPLLRLPGQALLFRTEPLVLGAERFDGWLVWNDDDRDGAKVLCVLPLADGIPHRTPALRLLLAPGFHADVLRELVEQAAAGDGGALDPVQRQTLVRVAVLGVQQAVQEGGVRSGA